MEGQQILVYLDHNILDLMTKGDPHGVKKLLKEHNFTPAYSDESLKEIQRSSGYENKFLELLEEIDAKYIEPLLDHKFKQTGQAKIHSISPNTCYKNFLSNQSEGPAGDFGISEMLMKFYGGQPDTSFEEIAKKGAIDLQNYLKDVIDGVEELQLEDAPNIESLKIFINELPEIMATKSSIMTGELDKRGESIISAFQKEIGIGPKVLNNVTPPKVVEKIWKMLSETKDFPETDMESFFGVKPHGGEAGSDRDRTLQETVNAVYHQLNFLGYYRDSQMKKTRRFKASFSDMTHAGIASFCHLFLCGDEDLVMKAAAAYEYAGVKTIIMHYKTHKPIR